MAQTTECSLLAQEFKKFEQKMFNAAMAPIRMLNTLNGMIMNAAMDALSTTQVMFDDLAESLGLDAIEDVLDELADGLHLLQNCSTSIGNNPLIHAAIGSDLASLNFGGAATALDIAGNTRNYAVALARKNALLALDKGMSAFGLEDGVVYHTYSSFARGLDGLWGMYQWFDRAPKGRNETGTWWRRHDEYGKR